MQTLRMSLKLKMFRICVSLAVFARPSLVNDAVRR
jgi:hypothetical protein